MAVAVVTRYPGMRPRTYDSIVSSLDLDANAPAGAILHVAGEDFDGMVSFDVWQTAETFRGFLDRRLRPALQEARYLDEPEATIVPLHNMFAADIDAIERLGATASAGAFAGFVR